MNERLVVMVVESGGYRVLLTADSGDQTEKELLARGWVEDVDVIKVGHHGSKYSSSQAFLEAFDPEIAVISVGKNSYGHPTSEVLERLRSVGAKIKRIDELGNVVVDFE